MKLCRVILFHWQLPRASKGNGFGCFLPKAPFLHSAEIKIINLPQWVSRYFSKLRMKKQVKKAIFSQNLKSSQAKQLIPRNFKVEHPELLSLWWKKGYDGNIKPSPWTKRKMNLPLAAEIRFGKQEILTLLIIQKKERILKWKLEEPYFSLENATHLELLVLCYSFEKISWRKRVKIFNTTRKLLGFWEKRIKKVGSSPWQNQG